MADVGADEDELPSASLKRIEKAVVLAETIIELLSTSISRPVCRATWTLIDKVLNRALDFDARILSPELFSFLAKRLDRAVKSTLVKILNVGHLTDIEEKNIRLAIDRGGCGIMACEQKVCFVHLAAAYQYLPKVANCLENLGWSRVEITGAIDFGGINQCLDLLGARNIFLGVDGVIHSDASVGS